MPTLTAILFIGVIAVLVGYAVYGLHMELRRLHRLHAWTHATGRILTSRLTQSARNEDGSMYNVVVAYQYEANGSVYTAESSLTPLADQCRRHAESLCRSHPRGAELRVVYDPQQPDKSEIAEPRGLRVRAIVPAVLVVVIASIFIFIRVAFGN